MTPSNRVVVIAIAVLAFGVGGAFVACGGSDNNGSGDDGGNTDGTLDGTGDGNGNGDGSGGDGAKGDAGKIGDAGLPDGILGNDSGCMMLGGGCVTNGECCSNQCTGGVCAFPNCAGNGAACNGNNQCCSLTCTNDVCANLNPNCETLGNACTMDSQCCSGRCAGNTCQPSSFCNQQGDICAQSNDCCSGNCVIPQNQNVGTCGAPTGGAANCKMPDGTLCSGVALGADGGFVYTDAGIPPCGSACCSRSCAPYGPTGILVCQPASGCKPEGDLCQKDDDCCGATGILGGSMKPVICDNIQNGYGICRSPMGCRPNGETCRLATNECMSACDCCSGNCHQDTCKQDNMGVPRCSNGQCQDAGESCASSADCCNGNPCIPNPVDGGQPPYFCYPGVCVPNCGTCTDNADCCPGESCNQVTHICDPCGGGNPDGGPGDGGVPDGEPPPPDASADAPPPPPDGGCASFGQLCTVSSQCCASLTCIGGRCGILQ